MPQPKGLKLPTEDDLQTEVVERKDMPGAWSVEAINDGDEGQIYQAIFIGPRAQERAIEYSQMKYGR